jgi:serine/threonine protein kinase
MHPLEPGDPKRLGDYVLSERLPEGPRGVAFLGQVSDDTPLRVIKLLTGKSHADADAVAHFTAVRRVSSSYIARTVDVGLHDGRLYIVREHVKGRSLAETVAADGPLGADAVERVAVGTLTALTAVHLAGITHRGLTPYNVIMGVDGLQITDLDLGEAAGEIGYRAPEQLRNEPCGSATDLFAWAATVIFAATGKAPFGHDTEAVLTGVPTLGTLTGPLRGVLLAALSKDVDQRPTTYAALLRLLGGQRAEPEITAKLLPGGAPPQLPIPDSPALSPAGGNAPIEGVPVQPQQSWQPPQQEQPRREQPQRPHILQAPVMGSLAPRRKFPIGLAASVAALMVLSGVALWGAGRYADNQKISSVDVAATGGPAGLTDAGKKPVTDSADGTVPQLDEPGTDQAQPEVTVPWATSSDTDPYGVGPLVLPTETPSSVPTAPVHSTVPTPAALPTQPVPTVQPTSTQQQTPQATSTQPKTPEVTKTVTEKPTEQNTKTPQQSQEPTPSPAKSTEPPSPSPFRSTQAPVPAPTTSAPPPAQPAPAKTAAPPPAQPEPKNPHTPAQVCGSGFYVQRSQSFNGGETFQLYNSGTKQNCVVTMKYVGVGKESPVSATLDVQGGESVTDNGNYKYYAGPVKLPAPGKCVKFSGSVGAGSTSAGWANCG